MEIYAPPGQTAIWPASINSVQLREAYPNTDFTPFMTVQEKAEFNLFQVQPTDPPTPDPAENRLEGPVPVFLNGQWVEQWQIVPLSEEEKKTYRRAMNPPRWNNFAASLMANPGVKQFLGNMVNIDAAAYGGLIGGLVQASNDRPEIFLSTWMEIKKQGVIPEQLSAFVVFTATQNDLPEEFIQSLAA
jgi:hypothetical protein